MWIGNRLVSILLLMLLLWGCGRKVDDDALRRIAILEDSRYENADALFPFIAHRQYQVRERAAAAAGRIGNPEYVPFLIKLLDDSNLEVRIEAIFALGQIGDEWGVIPLIEFYSEADTVERAEIVNSLGKIASEDALSFLRNLLQTGEERILPDVIMSLVFAKDTVSVPAIFQYLTHSSVEVRQAAVYAGFRLGDSTNLNQLKNCLNDEDSIVRKYCARALGKIGGAEAYKTLLPMLNDSCRAVRVQAINALGKCGDKLAVEDLLKLAESPDYCMYRSAIDALGEIGSITAAEPLKQLMRKDSGTKLPYLLIALSKIEGERFIPFLEAYSEHPNPIVKRGVAQSLMNIEYEASLALLEELMNDPEPTVRCAAVWSLSSHGEKAEPFLCRGLEDSDWAVRTAAAEGLEAVGSSNSFEALTASLQKNGPLVFEEQRAILSALIRLFPDKSLAIIKTIAPEIESPPIKKMVNEFLIEQGQYPMAYSFPADDDYPADFGLPIEREVVSVLTAKGRLEIELYGEDAPVVCASFLKLVKDGFYDSLTFHRVVPDFVVQGGDPRGDGWGAPGVILRDQINRRKFERGSVGLANSGLDTGGSQFFICLSLQPHLNGKYTLFGNVIRGMETADQLVEGDVIIEMAVLPKSIPKIREL